MKKKNESAAAVQTVKQKSNLRIAWSWFGTHVIALIFCLLITFCFLAATDNTVVMVLIGCLSLLIYVSLMQGPAWKQGNDDLNKVKFGRRKEDLTRGFKIGALAMVPIMVLSVLILLAKAELLPNFYVVYKVLNGHLLIFINLIDHTFEGVKTAFLTEVSWGSLIGVCILVNVVTPLVCGAAYILGYKNVLLMDKLVYQKKKESIEQKLKR